MRNRLLYGTTLVIVAALLLGTLASCGVITGDADDRAVTYELSADRKSVTFAGTADARAYGLWGLYVEDGSFLQIEDIEYVGKKAFRSVTAKTVSGVQPGETYFAFYLPSAKQEYTIVFGYTIHVDELLQLTVTEEKTENKPDVGDILL